MQIDIFDWTESTIVNYPLSTKDIWFGNSFLRLRNNCLVQLGCLRMHCWGSTSHFISLIALVGVLEDHFSLVESGWCVLVSRKYLLTRRRVSFALLSCDWLHEFINCNSIRILLETGLLWARYVYLILHDGLFAPNVNTCVCIYHVIIDWLDVKFLSLVAFEKLVVVTQLS